MNEFVPVVLRLFQPLLIFNPGLWDKGIWTQRNLSDTEGASVGLMHFSWSCYSEALPHWVDAQESCCCAAECFSLQLCGFSLRYWQMCKKNGNVAAGSEEGGWVGGRGFRVNVVHTSFLLLKPNIVLLFFFKQCSGFHHLFLKKKNLFQLW